MFAGIDPLFRAAFCRVSLFASDERSAISALQVVKHTGSPYATGQGGRAHWKSTELAERTPGVDEYTHVADPPRRFVSKELHMLECQRNGTPTKKGAGDGDIPGLVEDAIFVSISLRCFCLPLPIIRG